ncbi:complex I subunit 5 family protein [Paraburkholderia rhizosphaerae]|uniref:Formate hydrogenlyase subunit 3/multisubunit Na+/H+ antiporter MnhD subunit n=1 Tax=Paraburkholderia rhizosphaerae TaxID=480658 RepID=A0A4R8LNK4_9BURK|nr:proton-conducting transporter membrane subunit [Paraburkholderia rhizosphaerae]TDY45389.1 formate hydrogenlyase subunit 3/multisubunit Na+/H+ antiporter MnhD subunit [Paraburkholderia rhizosphaerae]
MTLSEGLMAAAIGVPLLMLLLCASAHLRRRLPAWFAIAPLPALAAAGASQSETLVLGNSRFALRFALDTPGALLLGSAALLWLFAGIFAARFLRDRRRIDGFVVCWLMAMTGSMGVFLVADLIGFYLMLAVLSVGASGLVLDGDGPDARYAGALYLGIALLAEAFLLGGLVLLAQATPGGSLLIRDAAAALPESPWRDPTLLLLLVGLGIKAGLVPLHFWMPYAYGAAPTPAAAVLSGAAVKASVIALLRFLPFGHAWPDFGMPLAALGLFGAFYGVAIGITHAQPKIVLAYSSVSQMGFVMAVIGIGLASGDPSTVVAAAFYAAHHLLVKGTLFLAVGVVALTGTAKLRRVRVPTAVIALGLGGLPLTGGALAKFAAKDVLGDSLAGSIAVASSVATTVLMLHFLQCLGASAAADSHARAPAALTGAWLAMVLASLAVPWALYLDIPVGTLPEALAPAALWSALWPVLAGGVLAIGWNRFRRKRLCLPATDVGDVLPHVVRAGVVAAQYCSGTDAFVRRWSVSCLTLLLAALLFGGLLAVAR